MASQEKMRYLLFHRIRDTTEWMQKNDKKKAFHMSWESVDEKFVELGRKGRSRSKKGRKK